MITDDVLKEIEEAEEVLTRYGAVFDVVSSDVIHRQAPCGGSGHFHLNSLAYWIVGPDIKSGHKANIYRKSLETVANHARLLIDTIKELKAENERLRNDK